MKPGDSMNVENILEQAKELNEAHLQLLELAEQKKQALINNQVSELSAIVQQETKWMKHISELEQQWRQSAAQFLAENGVHPGEDVTLSDVIRLVYHARDKLALTEARDRLLHTIERLKTVNDLNQELIRQSLAYIDYSLNLLMGEADDDAVYQKPETVSSAPRRRGIFDARA